MEAFAVSAGLVALAEIGDKTQLLALMLAARYRRPAAIVGGILLATVLNHALAAAIGAWVAGIVPPDVLRWILAASFLAMAAWILVPDRPDAGSAAAGRFGVFGTTLVVFFLAEMGDKTQIATVAMAAQFGEFLPVLTGSTLGMMLANVPVVLLGDRVAGRLPVRLINLLAALLFVALALVALVVA